LIINAIRREIFIKRPVNFAYYYDENRRFSVSIVGLDHILYIGNFIQFRGPRVA